MKNQNAIEHMHAGINFLKRDLFARPLKKLQMRIHSYMAFLWSELTEVHSLTVH